MRVGFCRADDPMDKKSWSGTPHFMFKALEKHCDAEIVSMGPLANKYIIPAKIIRQLSLRLTGKKYHYRFSRLVNREYARMLSNLLLRSNVDVLFFPAASGMLSEIETDLPCVYLSDATFRTMTDYHWNFSNLWEFNRREGELAEARAIGRANASVFASDWARNSAIRDYGASPKSTFLIPFGANLRDIPSDSEVLARRELNRSVYKLLFIGVNWEAKGGRIAVESCLELNRRGIPCELTVVGSAPPDASKVEHIHFVGFVDKNTKEGMKFIQGLYMEADFFILPTRNEAAGIVFCEASAYAVPCIATRSGGIPTYIEDGITGYLCEEGACASVYADKIELLVRSPSEYFVMAKNARSKFELELNWDSWGRRVASVLSEVLGKA